MIEKEEAAVSIERRRIANERSLEDMQHGFLLTDAMYFVKNGIEV